jgi:hypothetical protein
MHSPPTSLFDTSIHVGRQILFHGVEAGVPRWVGVAVDVRREI